MSQMQGMDTAAVRDLASRLHEAGHRLTELQAHLSRQLEQTAWRGSDREQFVQRWHGSLASHIRTVVQGLEEAATNARRNAADQDSASGAGAGSTPVPDMRWTDRMIQPDVKLPPGWTA